MTRRNAIMRTTLAAVLVPLLAARPVAAPADSSAYVEAPVCATQHDSIRIPEPLRLEHEEIHAELVAATRVPGKVGEAARALAGVLHAHFAREEQIALPPLGLLAPLARGETSPAMLAVLPLTDALRAELPRMLEEHVAIKAATLHMGNVAHAEANEVVAQLAAKLAVHARTEEEVNYPAAILVGDLVRQRISPAGSPRGLQSRGHCGNIGED